MNITERICIVILALMVGITIRLTVNARQDLIETQQTINEINATLYTTETKPETETVTTTTEVETTVATQETYLAEAVTEIEMVETEIYPFPEYDTSFKAYMDYRTITDTTTSQWRLQQQAWTDDYGLRRLNADYMVAMGTGYADEVGDRFQITFDNGEIITVVVGDIKADIHTDSSCRYVRIGSENVNVLEFIVDENKLKQNIKITGTVGTYSHLSGNITKIEGGQD